ncbi:membrane or secreted protein [Pontibacter sp. HSC-14F20]|uniref:membrane or secreted protein n=1 Tax=Pontibacter sp. HSC-14F20 TaxID=2864136 RepID=UPI001C733127|nr:membrane or secreted protein [Pontibacter sp. HSC-14F20]MBX0331915.1 membrane or secreted protein [Pontibacter sp. HSC-14F20]
MIKLLKNTFAVGLSFLMLMSCAGTDASSTSSGDLTVSSGMSAVPNETSATATVTASNQSANNTQQASELEGAWRTTDGHGNEVVMLLQDGFFTIARFNQQNKLFLDTNGGTYTASNGKFEIKYEFNTLDSTQVGTTRSADYKLEKDQWIMGKDGVTDTWNRINESNSKSPLAGTWRITGRERDGQMNTMRPGARKTLKVLSGTRFQWIAFNSETGQFSGTGGGAYSAENGRYTENIEFFSRDNSRVGMSLSFNFEVKDGNWHHSGQSSTGTQVNEIWSRISKD